MWVLMKVKFPKFRKTKHDRLFMQASALAFLLKTKNYQRMPESNSLIYGKNLLFNILMTITMETKVTDRIKTIEDARKATNRPAVDFSNVPEDLREVFEGMYDAIVVTEALNEGYKPDWDKGNELKWHPWFRMSPSAFAFCGSRYAYSRAYAGSGSRLKYPTEELAEYSAKQFEDIWKKVQLG